MVVPILPSYPPWEDGETLSPRQSWLLSVLSRLPHSSHFLSSESNLCGTFLVPHALDGVVDPARSISNTTEHARHAQYLLFPQAYHGILIQSTCLVGHPFSPGVWRNPTHLNTTSVRTFCGRANALIFNVGHHHQSLRGIIGFPSSRHTESVSFPIIPCAERRRVSTVQMRRFK